MEKCRLRGDSLTGEESHGSLSTRRRSIGGDVSSDHGDGGFAAIISANTILIQLVALLAETAKTPGSIVSPFWRDSPQGRVDTQLEGVYTDEAAH